MRCGRGGVFAEVRASGGGRTLFVVVIVVVHQRREQHLKHFEVDLALRKRSGSKVNVSSMYTQDGWKGAKRKEAPALCPLATPVPHVATPCVPRVPRVTSGLTWALALITVARMVASSDLSK